MSIKKEKIKHLKKLGFKVNTKDYEINEWTYKITTDNIQQAYDFGNGWISIKTKEKTYELFTRLVSVKNKIIGTPKIDKKTFNLYLNSCPHCSGTGKKEAYDINIIIADKNKSILDSDFFNSNIQFALKSIITKFKKENLFDLSKSFNTLADEEKNIFLFGFKEYKFLKPKGRVHAIGDYIRWQGIYSYVYSDLNNIKISDDIKKSKHIVKCPFCINGFKKEVEYYRYNDLHIADLIYSKGNI